MQWSKILTPLLMPMCAAATFFATTAAHAQQATALTQGDRVLLEMQQAARKGDPQKLASLLPATVGHPLEPWAAYWTLKARLNNASASDVDTFLQRWRGTYQEDRLRNDWLLLLGQRRQWAEFERLYADFRMNDDKELQCYALSIAAIEGRFADSAPEDLMQLWYQQPNGDDGCAHAASEFYAAKKIGTSDIWKRARLSVERNRQNAARTAISIIAPQILPQVREVFTAPAKYLASNQKVSGDTARELAVLALIRLAVNNPEQAAAQMNDGWNALLRTEQRHWVWGIIGKVSARKLSDSALTYFSNVHQPASLDEDTLQWMARAALRAGRWDIVRRAIEAMPPAAQADSTWAYWRARALQSDRRATQADQAEAQKLLQGIAGVHGFYEQLALEELGQRIAAPEEPVPLTTQERSQAQADPGLARALYAIRIGLRSEGQREWNYTVGLHTPGGMTDRELLAAADLACQAKVWDRCINTSERTSQNVASWQQRFPMPFREQVTAQSNRIGLDPAYVYGLIRQESRFIMDARSHVGASGLMQVMPATAKWTARKIGMKDFQPDMINDRDVNITIGTSYLKLALDDFEGSMPLAAAGYNAGPGRPRNWRNGPVLEAAVWAENVPFTETRDYVKKVLSNTTNYAALITGQPQSLRARLGTIGPKDVAGVAYNRDLP